MNKAAGVKTPAALFCIQGKPSGAARRLRLAAYSYTSLWLTVKSSRSGCSCCGEICYLPVFKTGAVLMNWSQ